MENSVSQGPGGRTGTVAPTAMAIGGVVGAVGSFLTWASVNITAAAGRSRQQGSGGQQPPQRAARSLSLTGLNTPAGKTLLAVSVAIFVVALLAILAYWFWLRLGAMALGLVLGVIALVWSAAELASPSSLLGLRSEQLSRRGIPVSTGIGLYLTLVGGIIAVVAAVAWLVMNRSGWASPAGVQRAPRSSAPAPRPDDEPTTQLPAGSPEMATD